jgi:enediyne biosynthesis protein E4
MKIVNAINLALFLVLLVSCTPEKTKQKVDSHSPQFLSLPSSQTSVTFNNVITENDSVNLIANEYSYIGAGVGIGDFNNDNLPDIYFTGNQVSSKLYINKGDFKFEDITEKAGVKTDFWATGVSVIDINNDGLDDIYVCASGSKSQLKRKNKLFINKGNLTFSEEAEAYGLADPGFSTQAVFLDYDKDGDLDMYLMNHLLYTDNRTTITKRDTSGKAAAADKLFRNEGISKVLNHPVFKDASIPAGIKEDGYGLGVIVSDFNDDSWPDIYVANDYTANDILWLNNKNGTFTNTIARSLHHQSYSSMGVDAADINNDGLTDLTTLDMLPETNEGKKIMHSILSNERFEMERRTGYEPQFMRNMLQLNNGVRNFGLREEPFFSEIGQLAGIHETDWSWSVLMADFDNDGLKDMHITNGYGRDMLNSDFILFRSYTSSQQTNNPSERDKALVSKLAEYGSVDLTNYLFKNNGDLTFSNISSTAGLREKSISNGCSYADLDNDGDLDLVVNNINKEAFILRNDIRKDVKDSVNNYLKIKLRGSSQNVNGIGAKIAIYDKGEIQVFEQSPVRGYASTVDKTIHFGVGKHKMIDSVAVIWPDSKFQTVKNSPSNQVLEFDYNKANSTFTRPESVCGKYFAEVKGINFKHNDPFFYDYQFQRFLPQKYSQLGPFISNGDLNRDGLEDFFIGGAFSQSGAIFLQQKNAGFTKKELTKGQKDEEDLGSLMFDAEGDGDLDLFINSGGYEYAEGSPFYKPRLYLNDGKGNFSLNSKAIPDLSISAQSVSASDIDLDGDLDLFIGGRVAPGQFPTSPKSYILQNNQGKFANVIEEVAPALISPGMITSSVWMDFTGDKVDDLVIAGEWMGIRFFKNNEGKLEEVTSTTNLAQMNGQWRSLSSNDLDNDGDLDLVCGNLGLNNKFKVSPERPLKFYVKDIDNNGLLDPIMAYYIINKQGNRELYPAIDRGTFASQVPSIKKKFLYHSDYSTKRIGEIFTPEEMQGMRELVCEETRTMWLENTGSGTFKKHELPLEAQFAPVNAIVCTDVNNDGNADIILAGNEYQAEVSIGQYDASYGLLLINDRKGHFSSVSPVRSGLILDGDVKDMKMITTQAGDKLLLVAINNSPMKIFKIK